MMSNRFVLMGKDEMLKDLEKNKAVLESDIKGNETAFDLSKTKAEELRKALTEMFKRGTESS